MESFLVLTLAYIFSFDFECFNLKSTFITHCTTAEALSSCQPFFERSWPKNLQLELATLLTGMVLPGLALAVLLGLMLDRGVEDLDVGALKRDGHYLIYFKGKRSSTH